MFLKKYLFYGGLANYKNLWLWLDSHFCGSGDEFDEPNPQFWAGIYHPRAPKVYEDVESYYKNFCKKDRPTIGVTFYREDWIWEDLEYQGQLIREIEKQGMNVICVFTNGMHFCTACRDFKFCGGGCFARWYGTGQRTQYLGECALKRTSIA